MDKAFEKGQKYALSEDVRLFINDKEIRLRKGIWNYEEGCLTLNDYSDEYVKCIKEAMKHLDAGDFTMEELDLYQLTSFEREQAETVLRQLTEANFVISLDEKILHQRITKEITGGLELFEDERAYMNKSEKSVIFCTDEEYVAQKWQDMSSRFNIKSSFLSQEQIDSLKTADLTTDIDSLTTYENMEKMGSWIRDAHVIVICMSQLSICLMRNINRLSIKEKIPVILSFIDGPTINMLSTKPYQTGCLECFERRALARIEDHVQYNRFVESARKSKTAVGKRRTSPIILLDMLANLSFSEGFLYSVIGASRFSGRLLSVYLPTMEIQMQNILRVPFCEACGTLAQAQFSELNVSSRRVIDDLSAHVFGKER